MDTARPDEEANLSRADLRLALAQADELVRKAEAILIRTRPRLHTGLTPDDEHGWHVR
jgi:hypothetical protein